MHVNRVVPGRVQAHAASQAYYSASGYPELEKALGENFLRDDSPSVDKAIRKLMAGRFRYVLVDKLSLEYQSRTEPLLAHLPHLKV